MVLSVGLGFRRPRRSGIVFVLARDSSAAFHKIQETSVVSSHIGHRWTVRCHGSGWVLW